MCNTMAGDSNYAKTTVTSLKILETINEVGATSGVDLADELGYAKSTVHKHLQTLTNRGYVREEDGKYKIGLKLLNLGESARVGWTGYSYIENAVDELSEITEEDVDFVAEQSGLVYTICESYHKWEKHQGSDGGYRANIGDEYYMHSVASGKAILATFSNERVREVIDTWGLPALTDSTITDPDKLFEQLERIREQGYAIGKEEYIEGLRSISQPVRLPTGQVLGALSVSGPAYRMSESVLEGAIHDAQQEVVESLETAIAQHLTKKYKS